MNFVLMQSLNHNTKLLQVHNTLLELRQEKEMAERDFVRIQGVLKYLQHLQNKEEPDPCPICKEIPKTKVNLVKNRHENDGPSWFISSQTVLRPVVWSSHLRRLLSAPA